MTELSAGQFALVCNFFSLTIAATGAAFLFLFGARSQVGPKYRVALLVSSAVVAITCYNYFCITSSWKDAFIMSGSATYVPSGRPFNNALHMFDWMLTAPLALMAIVGVIGKNLREAFWGKIGQAVDMQPDKTKACITILRLLLIVTLVLYPISFLLPVFGINPELHMTSMQIGYATSDIATKVFYGILIYWIARNNSKSEGLIPIDPN